MNFLKNRFSRNGSYGLKFTLAILCAVIFLVLFIGIVQDVVAQDPIVGADLRIMHLFAARRTAGAAGPFILLTYLGNWQFIVSSAFIITIVLLLLRKRRTALFLIISLASGEALSTLLKLIIHRSRPDPNFAVITAGGYSFPSGHALMAPIFYGFLGYLIYRTFRKRTFKTIVAALTIVLILLIGISRVYLGVHWASDVLAGWALGAALLFFFIALFGERERMRPSPRENPILEKAVIAPLAVFLLLIEIIFAYAIYEVQPIRIPERIAEKAVATTGEDLAAVIARADFPKYSETLTGENASPVSFIIVGSKEKLIHVFEAAGWALADPLNPRTLTNMVRSALFKKPYPSGPVSPNFLDGLPETVAFEQTTPENKVTKRHHTRFWLTGFTVGDEPIWVATASFDDSLRYVVTHHIDPNIDREREYMKNSLEGTGLLESISELQFVPPTSGKFSAVNRFFTDGKAYAIVLRSATSTGGTTNR